MTDRPADAEMKWPEAVHAIVRDMAVVIVILGLLWFFHGANISIGG